MKGWKHGFSPGLWHGVFRWLVCPSSRVACPTDHDQSIHMRVKIYVALKLARRRKNTTAHVKLVHQTMGYFRHWSRTGLSMLALDTPTSTCHNSHGSRNIGTWIPVARDARTLNPGQLYPLAQLQPCYMAKHRTIGVRRIRVSARISILTEIVQRPHRVLKAVIGLASAERINGSPTD